MSNEEPQSFKDGFAPILSIAFFLFVFGLSVSKAYQGFAEGQVSAISRHALFRLISWEAEPFSFAIHLALWSFVAIFSAALIVFVIKKVMEDDA